MGKKYRSKDVKKLKQKRDFITSPYGSVSDTQYRNALGRIRAAGHLKPRSFISFEKTDDALKLTISRRVGVRGGDNPHFSGYIQSPNDEDNVYKIKGWLNEDGRIRLEFLDNYPKSKFE